jgi:hypothetical protein
VCIGDGCLVGTRLSGGVSSFLGIPYDTGESHIVGQAQAVHALFNLTSPATGPFPSDWFTVADGSQNTQRRVNLPMPDCLERKSDCQDVAVINTLDGFNVDPRLSIPFDGAIDPTTVSSDTIFLVNIGGTACDGDADCDDQGDSVVRTVGINQVVWDPDTDTLHVQSDELLDQHSRYALIVTRGVRDQIGQPVEATEAFLRFRENVPGDYKKGLVDAILAARHVGVDERDIATASVFTTQSVTSVLEKMRDQIKAGTPDPADFGLAPGGTRTVFSADAVTGITWTQQMGADPPTFGQPVNVSVSLLQLIPGAVGTIAFGKYRSPDYEVHPGEFIPPVGTDTGRPDVQGANEIYFNLFLPSGLKPVGGWPVAILGHGANQNKNVAFNVAAMMAAHGIATIAINAVGHGLGPLGTLTVTQSDGVSVTFPAGGRGIDQNGNHTIVNNEGLTSAPPRTVLFITDGVRQTVADLTQLVRVIEDGIDADGDGVPDLNPSRIFYFGYSLGTNYGAPFLAVEPAVRAGDLTSIVGPFIENRRMAPATRRILGQALESRVPSLVNAPGIVSLAGLPVDPPQFHDNFPLRDGIPFGVLLADGTSQEVRSPVTNTVAGAMAIQEMIENAKWVGHSGDGLAYAPYLRKKPLPGVPAKLLICQFAKGDQSAPNPIATAFLRAGELADRTMFYRHDVAFANNPTVLRLDPHTFLSGFLNVTGSAAPALRLIALAAQEQIAIFFATDGGVTIQPQPAQFFEVPIAGALPEDLNFIP